MLGRLGFRAIRVFRGYLPESAQFCRLVVWTTKYTNDTKDILVGSEDDALVLQLMVVAEIDQQTEFVTSCFEIVVNLRPMVIA